MSIGKGYAVFVILFIPLNFVCQLLSARLTLHNSSWKSIDHELETYASYTEKTEFILFWTANKM